MQARRKVSSSGTTRPLLALPLQHSVFGPPVQRCGCILCLNNYYYATQSQQQQSNSSSSIKKRKIVPSGFWTQSNLIIELERATKKIGIQRPEDWYGINITDLKEVGFPIHRVTKTKLVGLLETMYPEHSWDAPSFLRGRYAQQKRLEKAVSFLFKDQNIIINARKEAGVINPETNSFLELDIFLPDLNLAFEYQDKHHYTATGYTQKPVDYYKTRDSRKKELTSEKGISLILVPCWWDGTIASLDATIRQQNPELLPVPSNTIAVSPIPAEIPQNFFPDQTENVSGLPPPTTACFFTNSNVASTVNWWMFEKYDGVRAFWNPDKKAFFSRYGKQFVLPQKIIDSMPPVFLDGELWFGRENFQEAMKIVHRTDAEKISWDKFKYMVFDVPNNTERYEDRYNELVEQMKRWPSPYVELATKVDCTGVDHLDEYYQQIIDQGGEGVILRDPAAPFQSGPCPGYLKHKKCRDAEAKVIGSAGLSEWECELPNGVRFTAPAASTEFIKKHVPKAGDIVSFKHRGYLFTTKKPKLPSIFRIRDDLSWDDVVNSWKEQKQADEPVHYNSQKAKRKHKQPGYWHQRENRRKFFCDLGARLGFNPFVAQNWLGVTTTQVIANKGAGIFNVFMSLSAALEDSFPEFNEKVKSKSYWLNRENRRTFFQELAKDLGLNLQDPSDWKKITQAYVVSRGGGSLLRWFKTVEDALAHTFPELQIKA